VSALIEIHPNGAVAMRCEDCVWHLPSSTDGLMGWVRLILAFATARLHEDEYCEARDQQLAMDL
jgi:hypothetical protein